MSTAPYMASNNVVTMLFNTTKAPLNDPKVRQAISYAINRQQLATQGESSYEAPATSSGGLLLPANQSLLSSQYANDLPAAGDPAKAASILTSDGWTKSGGKWTKNGQTLKFTLKDPSDFTDYYTDVQLIATQLNAQGFDVTAVGEAGGYAPWNTDVQNGNFDATLHWAAGPSAVHRLPAVGGRNRHCPDRHGRVGQLGPVQVPSGAERAEPARGREPPPPPSRPQWARCSRSCPPRCLRRHCFTARSGPSTPQRTTPAGPAQSNAYADPGPSNNQDVEMVILHLTPAS